MLSVHPLVPEDCALFARMVEGLYRDDPAGPVSMGFERALAQSHVLAVGSAPAWPFLLRWEGRPCGHLILAPFWSNEFGGLMAFIDELYVVPSFRGQGVGSGALTWAVEYARQRGLVRVELEVNRANVRARDLYLRMGFEDEERDLMGIQLLSC